jgi:hypothetical protein
MKLFLIIFLSLVSLAFGGIEKYQPPEPPTQAAEKASMSIVAYGKTEEDAKARSYEIFLILCGADAEFETICREFDTTKGKYWQCILTLKIGNKRVKSKDALKFTSSDRVLPKRS